MRAITWKPLPKFTRKASKTRKATQQCRIPNYSEDFGNQYDFLQTRLFA
jgi:hypothetical protein